MGRTPSALPLRIGYGALNLLEGYGALTLTLACGLYLLPLAALLWPPAFGVQAAAQAFGPLIQWLDWLSHTIGRLARWLALALVVVQFAVVILRYVFGINLISMQEALLYFHGALFLLAAASALLHDGHVRIDVVYRGLSARGKAVMDLFGTYVFLLPSLVLIGLVSFPYVEASWVTWEGSREASGIQGVFLLKTVILVFVALMLLQGLSLALRAALVLGGAPTPAKPKAGHIIA